MSCGVLHGLCVTVCWWCRDADCEQELAEASWDCWDPGCATQGLWKVSPPESAALKQASSQRPSLPEIKLLRSPGYNLQEEEGRWDKPCHSSKDLNKFLASPSQLEAWGHHFAEGLRMFSFLSFFPVTSSFYFFFFFRERRIVPEFIGTDCWAVLEVRNWTSLLI